ncbi:metallophosphoesterase, partial [Frankia sp. AgB1.9]|uniref:metallophosphoesterase family protein n=1 Tax=Frankia sp. AgB1.9 TaxID=1836968 RepID=UPI001EE4493A
MQIAQISDTHLTHRGGLTEANFRCLIAYLNEVARPDVVVITGDIQVMHPDDADERLRARLTGLAARRAEAQKLIDDSLAEGVP